MNLIILGAPGSGKGTQAKLIAAKFALTHVSSGNLLRQEAESNSDKGKIIADLLKTGQLLPFETVLDVLEPVILKAQSGFILDGTPRDLHQAEYLDYFLAKLKLPISKVIFLDIPHDVAIARLLKRAKIENRTDDNHDTVLKRLDIYEKDTAPVVAYYQQKDLLLKIDGTPTIEAIFNDIVNRLTLA